MDLEKIMKSRAIMDRVSQMDGGEKPKSKMAPIMEDFDTPSVKYNIPQDMLAEAPRTSQMQQMAAPASQFMNKPYPVASSDAIKNSKLPDEIKKLMMENPIAQPAQQTATLSDDLIERASRLMKENKGGYVPESAKPKTAQAQPVSNTQIDYKMIKKMVSQAVNEALEENGLLIESTEKSNEMFTFKVGKHIFEGRVTKIKKTS